MDSDVSGVYNLRTGLVAMPVLREPDEIVRAPSANTKVAMISDGRRRRKLLGDNHAYPSPVWIIVGSRPVELIINSGPRTRELKNEHIQSHPQV